MKVSVIVPVYNVEKYLDKCVTSIINQTYKDLEIILIDDGSTDSSLKICKKYEKQDNRIKVIHQTNKGVSEARNKGLDNAKGKYISFIDADDYVKSNFIEVLMDQLIKNNTKISQCGINITLNNKIIRTNTYNNYEVKDSDEILTDLLKYNLLQNEVIWNKLYDASLFKDLRFIKGKLHEDDYINYQIYYQVKKVSIVPTCLYNYRQEGTSITSSFYKKRLDGIDAIEGRIKFFEERNKEDLKELAINYNLKFLRNTYFKVKEYLDNNDDILKKILVSYKNNYKLAKFDIRNMFFYYAPNTYYYGKKIGYKILNKKI